VIIGGSMKKKIIFMLIDMNIGGTEKALLNMISEFKEDEYEITILMLEKHGGFLDYIPDGVHTEYVKGYDRIKQALNQPPQVTAVDYFKKGKVIKAFNISLFHLISKVTKNRSFFFKYILKNQPVLTKEYDVAVAYAGPMDFISYFVVNKIKARRKIQWIHFDVTKIGFNDKFASKIYDKFDKLFVVSEEAKNKLINKLPSLKEKTDVFLNVVSSDIVLSQSKKDVSFNDDFDGIRILTVGRLTKEKGQDLAIRVMAQLISNSYKIKWYCIGDGNSRIEYEKLVATYDLQDHFIFLGADPNPYPYIAKCDIYVQPSRYEGYCITLIEARCLLKPIITTDVNGAKEQIRHGETGMIVSINENEIYHAIVQLINNKSLCTKFSENLSKESVDNSEQMKKINYVITSAHV
jgi:glycosyltransferase involved in cell wall biosynthesis